MQNHIDVIEAKLESHHDHYSQQEIAKKMTKKYTKEIIS